MKHAVFTFGRFNPPTESGHGKLVNAVKSHAESVGGDHFIFPSHSQDAKKNPLSHEDKVSAMHKIFPKTNIVSHPEVKTAIHAMKHLENKGYKHATMVVGSDRVGEFHNLLNKYNGKEYNFKKIHVKSAGNRDPDAEGAEGMSASKLRGLVLAGKRDEFISHYSNKKVGAEIHDKVKSAMNEETTAPIAVFLFGGPGSGKDYLVKNIFSRFDLHEVPAEKILNGTMKSLLESPYNIVVNCSTEVLDEVDTIKNILEGYEFDHVLVSVSNKVSRIRNSIRENPLSEDLRISKLLLAENLAKKIPDIMVFNNSLNLNESSEMEKIFFGSQIQILLERLVGHGLVLREVPAPKKFSELNESLKIRFKKKMREEVVELGTDRSVELFKAMTPGENNVRVSKKSIQKEKDCRADTDAFCACSGCAGSPVSEEKSEKKGNKKVIRLAKNIKINLQPELTRHERKKSPVTTPNYQDAAHAGAISYGGLNAQHVYEAIQYHKTNNISLVENAYRPGSDMFFAMIKEAKKRFAEGKYTPRDEDELDLLTSDIGETAIYEGKEVFLDFPFEVLDEEGSDPTKGHGIGKPFRKGGGGAVYVRSGDGVKLVNFSQSGMTKKFNNPARLKSFMARHNCLSNKDKTSASYWACRWPRYFSSGGQQWW
jgi:hypothetical protein